MRHGCLAKSQLQRDVASFDITEIAQSLAQGALEVDH